MNSRKVRFEVHKAQKIAAAFLLLFLIQALWLVGHLPLTMAETRNAFAGEALWSGRALSNARSALIPGDSILTLRCAGLLPWLARHWQQSQAFSIYAAPSRWLVRLPFVAFGVWLGGALWWVSRRLFGDEGGYVALALYCFSPAMLIASATVESGILASWGLFGLVFTAIGVAHTLYAPPQRWRPRIVLLGTAIGLTAAANFAACLAGLVLAGAFMVYLAPGRRRAAFAILTASSGIGAIILLLCFDFKLQDLRAAGFGPNAEYLRFTAHRVKSFFAVPGGVLEVVVFAACIAVFCSWRRTRYFGLAAPLIVALLLPWWPGQYLPGSSLLWSLPFGLVFTGGIYADLLEQRFFAGRFRKLVATTALVVVAAGAVLSLAVVTGA